MDEDKAVRDIIVDTVEKTMPLKNVRTQSKKVKKPWTTHDLPQDIKERQIIKISIKLQFWQHNIKNAEIVNNLLNEVKQQYYRSKLLATN